MKKFMVLILLVLLVSRCSEETVEKKVIACPDAPAAIGPYSQAIQIDDMLYLSGQLGLDPETGKFAGESFEAQAKQALDNQKAILEFAGFSLEDVVQCQVFVTDLNNYGAFNDIYKTYFKSDYPARAVLEVSRIPADGLVEIMMVAVKDD
jgi:2-iminobutanoate/2-iminopropanoate deaminase